MTTTGDKPEHFMINDADAEAHDGPHGAKPTAIADTLGTSGTPNPLGKGHLRLYALCAIVYLCSTMNAIFTALAPSLGSFIGARFLLSFFSTIAYVAAPLLLVEIAPPLHRGKVAGIYNTLYYMGSIIATFAIYGCNLHLHGNLKWRLPLWLQILCPGLVVVGGYFIPESPRWLITRGREAEARAFIVEYHANGEADHPIVDIELNEIRESLREGGIRSARDYFDLRSLVRKRSSRYRLMLAIAMAWFGQFSGNNIASYYLPLLVKNVGITSTNTVLLMNAIYAVAGWVAATTGAFFHDVWGRRKMLMGSCIGMAVSLAIVAATAADYVHTGSHPSSYASIVFIYIFGVVFAFSFTPMQPIYPAEVLSNNMRANGMMVFQITAGCSSFVNTYAAPVALNNIKYWFYVFFVFWDLFEATVIYFFFVETKDRTLEELDEVFEAKNPRKASTCKTEKTVQNPRRISSEVAAPKRDRVLNVVVAAFVVTIAPLPVASVAFRELSNSCRSLQTVISTLFPSTPINELDGLSRDQLVDLLQKAPTSETADNDPEAPASDLLCLEPPPEREFTWDEVSDEEMPRRRVADDVNGLSLFIDDSKSSYLGLTSVPAILRVMTNISPQIRSSISKRSQQSEGVSQPSKPVIPAKSSNPKTSSDELRLIDAYFFYVHGITPMIDEVDFRRRYAEGVADQNKGPWIALVNMVLAMGYIASSMSDQDGHSVYYEQAAEHLNFRCLGSGHIDTVQALTILGGYYLHYLNRPNMASAILGATIRMAVAIGLHRVPFQPRQNGHHRLVQLPLITPAEIEKLDSELMSWHASLPVVFRRVNECPPQLRVTRGVLRWRFLTLRLTLYRPYALIQSLQVYSQRDTDKTEMSLVTTCRAIAKEVIETIKLDWFPNQICAWNSVWYLFQACLVILLSVISEPDSDARPEWDRTIRETVDMLHEMTAWSPGAARSREVICFLYEAQGTKATSPAGESPNLFDFESSFWNFFDMDQLSADTGWDQSLFPGVDAFGTAAWSLM
ncbi:hypothetical protein ZTR_03232 [Talaromyces verruculosus]|nr:hypothetical protein ZTR_03232 [Talaromyces verruculosus]